VAFSTMAGLDDTPDFRKLLSDELAGTAYDILFSDRAHDHDGDQVYRQVPFRGSDAFDCAQRRGPEDVEVEGTGIDPVEMNEKFGTTRCA